MLIIHSNLGAFVSLAEKKPRLAVIIALDTALLSAVSKALGDLLLIYVSSSLPDSSPNLTLPFVEISSLWKAAKLLLVAICSLLWVIWEQGIFNNFAVQQMGSTSFGSEAVCCDAWGSLCFAVVIHRKEWDMEKQWLCYSSLQLVSFLIQLMLITVLLVGFVDGLIHPNRQ